MLKILVVLLAIAAASNPLNSTKKKQDIANDIFNKKRRRF